MFLYPSIFFAIRGINPIKSLYGISTLKSPKVGKDLSSALNKSDKFNAPLEKVSNQYKEKENDRVKEESKTTPAEPTKEDDNDIFPPGISF